MVRVLFTETINVVDITNTSCTIATQTNTIGDKMTIQEKRDLLNSLAGKFTSVTWTKADGTETTRTIKHMQHDLFAAGHATLAQKSTVADKPEYYTAVCVKGQKWVNINLNTLSRVKCGEVDVTYEP